MIQVKCLEVASLRLKAKTNRAIQKSKFNSKLMITRRNDLPKTIEKRSTSLEKINSVGKKLLPIKTLEIDESRNVLISNSYRELKKNRSLSKKLFFPLKKITSLNSRHYAVNKL